MGVLLTVLAAAFAAAFALAACGGQAAQNPADTKIEESAVSSTVYIPQQTEEPSSALPEGKYGSPSARPEGTAEAAGSTRPEEPEPQYRAIPLPGEMRAMWVSFLEWRDMDISTEGAMRQNFGRLLDNCKAMGLNTVIAAVRPFSDALYRSAYYPWSHLITGTQGEDPGYDPLRVMTEEAHARSMRIEAWVNPFRVSHPEHGPEALAGSSPAVLNPSWVREQGGQWLDPGLPEVREMVVDGVAEILENYDVDGVHFDDYFYPEGNTDAFDAETYALYGEGGDLAGWRRENINEMIRNVYTAAKAANPTVSFGVSPQGNNENNYNEQHCDIRLWMAEPGYADYIMPQLYWGFHYMGNGGISAAFANKTAEWSGYTLRGDARLYAGLGAYRIGGGDGGDGPQDEWQSGHNLADMAAYLREDGRFSGFALFRYDSLYPPEDDPYRDIAASETAALTAMLRG
jgi:uncharacterized lipoprotein YddW (UPF0748 family)